MSTCVQYVVRVGSDTPGYTIGTGEVHPPLRSNARVGSIRVKAINDVGAGPHAEGPCDDVVTLVEATTPSAPQQFHVGVASTTEIPLRWDPPAVNGGADVEWCVV